MVIPFQVTEITRSSNLSTKTGKEWKVKLACFCTMGEQCVMMDLMVLLLQQFVVQWDILTTPFGTPDGFTEAPMVN